MKQYLVFKNSYSNEFNALNRKHIIFGILRLLASVILVFLIYKYFTTYQIIYLVGSILIFIGFIGLMKVHQNISWNRKIRENLIAINDDEINYLNRENNIFENGAEFINHAHFYSFDLDIFGPNSLFQNLNRTATYIGFRKLSELLLNLFNNDEIKSNQQAIKELSNKIEFRQYLLSLAKINKDTKQNYQKLMSWSLVSSQAIPKFITIVSYLTPAIFIISLIGYFISDNLFFTYTTYSVFFINLAILIVQMSKINRELIDSDNISKIVKQYGFIIERIESEKFESKKLILLQEKLIAKSTLASVEIKKLSILFSNLDSISNPLGAILFNGAFLYHIHALNNLLKWKKQYSKPIQVWLEIIGEFESLNSLANFYYNNPTFIFPELNENYQISVKQLGHPLIEQEKRVCNSVEFNTQNFMILTGSNMSGKSTFLRSLGINMVLAGIGAPICADQANIHPLQVLVSMRQSDSLYENESYFFAEIKRLKQIMDKLETQVCFVLLDEILKGTNSDDKQTGTIEIIKKIISKRAIGTIATHDLEVCQTTNEYPNTLMNKCFEVEIIENDLAFDYKLKDGICKNKSALFLMQKMEII